MKLGDCSHCHGFGKAPVDRIEDATLIYRPAEKMTFLALFDGFTEQIASGEFELQPGDLMFEEYPCLVCRGQKSVAKVN